jgi:DUF4097 and DUF4098 domain-containing protein YvlB
MHEARERTHEAREREHEARERVEHALGADYDYTQVTLRTFDVESGETLWLDTDFGQVTVRGDGGSEVVVTVIKAIDDVSESEAEEFFDRFDLDFDQSSDGISIEGEYEGKSNWGRRNRLHIIYEISVPHTDDVEVETAGGSITAEYIRGEVELNTAGGSITSIDIDGPLSVETAGGSIKAENIGGDAELQTAGGSITARDVRGSVEAETSGGSITVENAEGDVEAETSGGSITLTGIQGTANAETSGGSITAELTRGPDGPMTLETSAGSITLRLTEGTSIDIDAKASGGRVRTDLDIEREGAESKTKLKGELNGGGPLVTLRTSAGSIKILKR